MSAPSMNRLGATPEEWDHFSRMLGLTGDLLPVVCDPAIPIAWVFRRNVTAESGERDRSVRLNVTGESG
ncbi:MAG: hypothetical protein ING90_20205 [Rhodocyclaceae bacterium]|nr:hypothetical protein [Rhodocyclaceae bacterium]